MANSGFIRLFRKWISSVDHGLLFSVLAVISLGIWVSIASTPAVAMKLGLPPFYFVKRHILIIPIALFVMIFISFLQARHIRKMSIVGYILCLCVVVCTLWFGTEVKGARRWLVFFGFSVQPAEFLKPILTVMTAWLISEQYRDRKFPGILLSFICVSSVACPLLMQPDVGMTIIIVGTWFSQLFISGLSVFMISAFVFSALAALGGFYFIFPHFADRIDKFMLKSGPDTDVYQIQKSMEAFKGGGFFGKGPGEGVVKMSIPDSHSDFVFAVIGEEFGFITCIFTILLFIIIIVRPMVKIMKSSSIFSFSVVFGILFQFGMQVLINISTALNLIPTKGMTLPFISYGGSSIIASAISIGILLALTKRSAIMMEVL